MGCKPLFSMPHTMATLFPFILATISLVLSFRTLSSCDLISTKWSIDCSSTFSSQCVLKTNLNLGILAKETYVNPNLNTTAQPNMDELHKVCTWYSEEEREWLLGKYWDIAFISQIAVVACALFGIFCIGVTSCYAFKRNITFKILSFLFMISAIVNAYPLILQFTSDFCTLDEGICDPTQSFCVNSCSWGSGSWQTLAASLMWISTSITTWLIPPGKSTRNVMKYNEEDDEESSYQTDTRSVEIDSFEESFSDDLEER